MRDSTTVNSSSSFWGRLATVVVAVVGCESLDTGFVMSQNLPNFSNLLKGAKGRSRGVREL